MCLKYQSEKNCQNYLLERAADHPEIAAVAVVATTWAQPTGWRRRDTRDRTKPTKAWKPSRLPTPFVSWDNKLLFWPTFLCFVWGLLLLLLLKVLLSLEPPGSRRSLATGSRSVDDIYLSSSSTSTCSKQSHPANSFSTDGQSGSGGLGSSLGTIRDAFFTTKMIAEFWSPGNSTDAEKTCTDTKSWNRRNRKTLIGFNF